MSAGQTQAGDVRAAVRPLTIAVASGKGGTGKTTVSTNLAETAAATGMRVHLLDTDVEEPNCHIFVSPYVESRRTVTTQVPVVDESACTGCGACAEICQYSAIAMAGNVPITFPALCHSCTGCALVCPTGAITLHDRGIGTLEFGCGGAGGFAFTQGSLNVGESVSSPVIHAVKAANGEAELTLIDAPPGTACPVVEAVHGADYIILVTEPTPVGLNDLELAVDAVPEFRARYQALLTEVLDAARAAGAAGGDAP